MPFKTMSSCTVFLKKKKSDLNWYCKMQLFSKEYFGFFFLLVERYINSTTKNERINTMFENVIYKQSLSLCFKCFLLKVIKNRVERTLIFFF